MASGKSASAPRDPSYEDGKLGEYDLTLDRNAYPRGPMSEGRGIYRIIGWEGSDRGGLLLSEAEANAIRSALRDRAAVSRAEARP